MEDCAGADPDRTISYCSAEGRCKSTPRPPHLKILEPENDTLLPEGTRRVRLTGEVSTYADDVDIEITASAEGCLALGRRTTIPSPTPGTLGTISFLLDDIELDPGLTRLSIEANAGGGRDKVDHLLEVPCPGCATIRISEPVNLDRSGATTTGLELPTLRGQIGPDSVRTAIWRVRSTSGDIFDGRLPVSNGGFSAERLPLFAGRNRLEVTVTGVGSGLGESRCSTTVTSGKPSESGLRVLLTWDGGTSDLDAHLVGGGAYLEPGADLFSRSPIAAFGGEILDDFDGYGPETIRAETLPDGVYGLAVEPFSDGAESGSNAFVRVLYDGRLLFPGAAGPRYLTVREQKLWVVGKLVVAGGQVDWQPIDAMVSSLAPPTTPPDLWPTFD
ncbi:MAG: hypothetical protein HYV07_00600 [Deltaproteobacteria bacterium]|nr:hypothetical protein [Deltaproteobacteria bacterium]